MARSHISRAARAFLAWASLAVWFVPLQAAAADVATIRHVAVLGGSQFELEISASQPVHPQAQLITGPDRLVLDFAGTVPAGDLRNLTVNRGEVKSVRVGLFAADPPVTRVVVDLKQAQTYQLFPSGNSVIVKLGAGAALKTLAGQQVSPAAKLMPVSLQPAKPDVKVPDVKVPEVKVEVRYENGWLSIWANRATLAEVLFEVHRRTGADVPIPAGAEQDLVVTSLGPAPAREVLSSLLNGSRFNFIVVGADGNPNQLKSLILTPRGQSAGQPMITYTQPAVAQSGAPPEPEAQTMQEDQSEAQPQPQQPQTKDQAPPQ
jgi:hypothetical protein